MRFVKDGNSIALGLVAAAHVLGARKVLADLRAEELAALETVDQAAVTSAYNDSAGRAYAAMSEHGRRGARKLLMREWYRLRVLGKAPR